MAFLLISALALSVATKPSTADGLVTVTVSPDQPGTKIPADFLGFSHEAPVLAQDYFDVNNAAFVHLLTALGQGTLRFGGNSVEWTYWGAVPATAAATSRAGASGSATLAPRPVTLLPADLDRMLAFAEKTQWRVILGVNLGYYSPKLAADEAAYAWKADKAAITAIEIGNEPDLFPVNGLRSPKWTVSDLRREFDAYVSAIHAAVPEAPIAGPVTCCQISWFTQFLAADSTALALATYHIYPLSATVSPDSNRYANIANMLSADTLARTSAEVVTLRQAAAAHNVPLRIAETNSTNHGNQSTVPMTFVSALWGTDYLFMLAQHGIVGANFHGGFTCQGYTPICQTPDGQFHAQPLYYAMLLFHLAAADGQLVPASVHTSSNVTAYAVLGADKRLRVVLINKTSDQPVMVQLNAGRGDGSASVLRLNAPSIDAQDGITLGGHAVAADGTWSPTTTEALSPSNNGYRVALPAASAVLLILD